MTKIIIQRTLGSWDTLLSPQKIMSRDMHSNSFETGKFDAMSTFQKMTVGAIFIPRSKQVNARFTGSYSGSSRMITRVKLKRFRCLHKLGLLSRVFLKSYAESHATYSMADGQG